MTWYSLNNAGACIGRLTGGFLSWNTSGMKEAPLLFFFKSNLEQSLGLSVHDDGDIWH